MRNWKRLALQSSDTLYGFLTQRAVGRSEGLGHVLSSWSNAKRKMGKGAFRAMCTRCGRAAFVLPHGQHGLVPVISRDAPAMTGEALTAQCVK